MGNLLSGNGKKRWLSAPKLKTGQIEAVFELERPCVITHIDIGMPDTHLSCLYVLKHKKIYKLNILKAEETLT